MTKPTFTGLIALAIGLVMTGHAVAQVDRVYLKAGNQVSGKLTVSKKGVSVDNGNKKQNIPAGEIEKIVYQGAPAGLTKGREFVLDGQYDQALEELKTVDIKATQRKVIAADTAFYLSYCKCQLALAGRADKKAAAKEALAFLSTYRDSWHFFTAAATLGKLTLADGDPGKAITYFKGAMGAAVTKEQQMEGVYLGALAKVAQGDFPGAAVDFDKVIGLDVQSVESARIRTLAKAAKSVALAKSGDADGASQLVDQLVEDLDPTDIELAARIYNAQGAMYEAKSDSEGAVHSYLHTHLMFSAQADAHAQALSRLAVLWPKVSQPARAAEAKQSLRKLYPGYSE
ncbi:MAG: hypothetical protein AAGA03_11585 [Planctomycetota bacterium]